MINTDNISAFSSKEYDPKIKQTLPYYEDFYKQVIELVKVHNSKDLAWLDVGCGTGKMGSVAFGNLELQKFVFCDCSEEMIQIVQNSFKDKKAEFLVSDVQKLSYVEEFDVVTAIQVNHYLYKDERRTVLQKYYEALKENGLFVSFENFAPFTDIGKRIGLEKWRNYQISQGKSPEESEKHIQRYGKDYFPITLTEHMELMQECGFKVVEILWLSNMQVGIWGMK